MSEPNSPREAVDRHRADELKRKLDAVVAEILNTLRLDAPRFVPLGEPDQAKDQAEMKIAEAAVQEKNRARFKVGDVVVLLSGGPRMAVWEIRSDGIVGTVWFSGSLLQRDAFAAAEIEYAPPKETP